jgi:hypothetical protein
MGQNKKEKKDKGKEREKKRGEVMIAFWAFFGR